MIYNDTLDIYYFQVLFYLYWMDLAETYKAVKPAVIALAIKREIGNNQVQFFPFASGICVDPSGIFITAKHCVVDDESIRYVKEIDFCIIMSRISNKPLFELLYFKPIMIFNSEDQDIAIMKIPYKKENNFPYIKMPSDWKMSEGESVGCSGFPVTYNPRREVFPNVFSGIISRIDFKIIDGKLLCNNIILDMCLHKGNSGGPVFNSNGELIAIISNQELRETDDNSIDRKLVWTNLIHCVPYTVFYNMVEQIKKQNNG